MSFSLTRKTDYALIALASLAHERRLGGEPKSARQIAEEFDLPLQLLMNLLKELHRARLVNSRRGVSGGYFLELAPEEINLKQVVEAIEGPVSVTLCSGDHEPEVACQIVGTCPIIEPIRKFHYLVEEFLAGTTIKQLMESGFTVPSTAGVNV